MTLFSPESVRFSGMDSRKHFQRLKGASWHHRCPEQNSNGHSDADTRHLGLAVFERVFWPVDSPRSGNGFRSEAFFATATTPESGESTARTRARKRPNGGVCCLDSDPSGVCAGVREKGSMHPAPHRQHPSHACGPCALHRCTCERARGEHTRFSCRCWGRGRHGRGRRMVGGVQTVAAWRQAGLAPWVTTHPAPTCSSPGLRAQASVCRHRRSAAGGGRASSRSPPRHHRRTPLRA